MSKNVDSVLLGYDNVSGTNYPVMWHHITEEWSPQDANE
jgi:hypothetical protein